jgi:hypothetical protein
MGSNLQFLRENMTAKYTGIPRTYSGGSLQKEEVWVKQFTSQVVPQQAVPHQLAGKASKLSTIACLRGMGDSSHTTGW